jgi:hypothetical protein
MSLIVESATVQAAGETAEVRVRSDQPITSCQFLLLYDPAALLYIDHTKTGGGGVNAQMPGSLRCVVGGDSELAQPCFVFRFTVSGPSAVSLGGDADLPILATDNQGPPPNQYTPGTVDGSVTFQEESMQIVFTRSDPREQDVVTSWKIYQTVDPDPTVGPVTEIGEVDIAEADSPPVERDAGQGVLHFFGEFINAVGPSGPGPVIQIDTDPTEVPQPPTLTHRIL